jgi:hypothetical protein
MGRRIKDISWAKAIGWGELLSHAAWHYSVFGNFFIVELIHIPFYDEICIELKQPSDNVNRNQDTLYDVEASFTGFGHLRVSGAIHALADGLLRTLPKDHIDSEYAGSYAKTEVDCQDHGKAGDHASAFHQTTDESQYSKKGEKGEHHRLNPERNFFTLIQRMLTELGQSDPTDSSHKGTSNHCDQGHNENTKSDWQAAEEGPSTNI